MPHLIGMLKAATAVRRAAAQYCTSCGRWHRCLTGTARHDSISPSRTGSAKPLKLQGPELEAMTFFTNSATRASALRSRPDIRTVLLFVGMLLITACEQGD